MVRDKILVVDDNEISLFTMVRFLSKIGLKVLSAKDGQEALKIFSARKEEIKIFFTELHMPFINGLDLIKVIEADQEANHEENEVIFMITTASTTLPFEEAREKTPFFFFKPIDFNLLKSIILEEI